MSNNLTPIDISNMPDLLDLVEKVESENKPRELIRDNKPVAIITPIFKSKEEWEKIKAAFGSWSDLNADELIANIYNWRKTGSRPAVKTS
ncbi:MAG TPA: hypothetical protein VJ508_01820 [Saprospiraceae bacterium]|nr:hypothetical protein [Saprospiraceae bacterium]